jgi:hypothetical protein
MRGLGRMRTMIVASGICLLAAALAGAGGARAASKPAASTRAGAVITGYTVPGQLNDVAATSPDNAWAVGDQPSPSGSGLAGAGDTLLLHWNGKAWSQVTNPKPVYGSLISVSATSADNAWAVGAEDTPKVHTYVLHWDGRSWTVQKQPPSVEYASYSDVATSGADAWIVGLTTGAVGVVPPNGLAVHRTGGQWYFTPVPDSSQTGLRSVAFSGGNTAWAVGCVCYSGATSPSSVILRWTGTMWKVAARYSDAFLYTISEGPGGIAWAVGNGSGAISAWWNGKSWQFIPSPVAGRLWGVSYFPGGAAWAVGSPGNNDSPLILRWTGKAWRQVATPGGRQLLAVAGDSANDGWAVGGDGNATTILHWNGKAWS